MCTSLLIGILDLVCPNPGYIYPPPFPLAVQPCPSLSCSLLCIHSVPNQGHRDTRS
uniref:Uncharacterized protein n=1 Tax=Ficedula albicollis TaxID=59894 RepID=A0A803W681_FICAL